MSSLLALVGLNPNAADNPVRLPSVTTFVGLLEIIRREIGHIFFNESPALAHNPNENVLLADGRVEGNLNPTDPDSATLTYTATDPAHGSVVVNPDGTFTYTPDAGSAGPDIFDVTVSDADSGFHIHGLPGLLSLVTFGLLGDSGHTFTQRVTVGFERNVLVSGLDSPVDFVFLPDGRIVIAEKEGAIKLYKNGQLQDQPLVVLPVNSGGERGIEGLAVDPDFANNGFLYVAYTSASNFDRLSRLTVSGDTASLASELVLLESTQSANGNHHGGGLGFGHDGKLYWGLGDNSVPSNSQSLSTIHGKILRINPDGTVPADNPFIGTTGALPQIYAYGFRNPFRLTFTPDGDLLVADVGAASWEELNLVTRGGNYGWPNVEGTCNGCQSVNPIYTYPRGSGAAITSVLVYTGTAFGPDFQDKVFIADLVQGWIKMLTCTSDFSSCGSEATFDNEAGTTVKLAQGPDGSIYQLTHSPGVLFRIGGNAAPTAAVSS